LDEWHEKRDASRAHSRGADVQLGEARDNCTSEWDFYKPVGVNLAS